MTIRSVSEAKAQLSALLVLVEQGEEVVISRAGKPVARLSRFERSREPRKLGLLKGSFNISDDFDAPDPELERLFYEWPIEPTSLASERFLSSLNELAPFTGVLRKTDTSGLRSA
jgi:prevent-host-death family protein